MKTLVGPTLALMLAGPVVAAPDTVTLKLGESVYARCAACHAIDTNRTATAACHSG